MAENKDVHEDYLSVQFGSIHELNEIKRHYGRYRGFVKHNYIKYFKDNKEAVIIDVGCGLGETLHALKTYGFKNATGIDLSGECVEFCRKEGFAVEKADALTYFREKKEIFDVIIMNDVIEHIKKENIIPFLTGCRHALKRGGLLMIKTFNSTNPLLGPDSRYFDFTHEIGFTPTSLRQVLLASGFSKEKVSVSPSNIYVYYFNPLNYAALLLNGILELCLKMYFKMQGRLGPAVFSKNIIAVGGK